MTASMLLLLAAAAAGVPAPPPTSGSAPAAAAGVPAPPPTSGSAPAAGTGARELPPGSVPAPEASLPPEARPAPAGGPAPAPPIGDAAAVRGFADHLFASGDFYRAIGEYQRYLFVAPGAPDAGTAQLAIGRAYLLGGRPADAAAWFDRLAAREEDPARLGAWRFQAGLAKLLDEDHDGAARELARAAELLPAQRGRALLLSGLALAADDQDEAAVERLREAAASPELSVTAGAVADELEDRDELTAYRSPVAAGAFSAVLPGAGHLYVGEVGIGLTALAWNGVFAAGIYQTVHDEAWGLTAALAAVEALFYFGAITGAVSAAHKFNRDARLNHLDDLKRRYPILDVERTELPEQLQPRRAGGR